MVNIPSRARKRFGQHFLHDSRVIERIAGAATHGDPQHIVEIGPGRGAITGVLQAHAQVLTLIEIDHDLAALHRQLWRDKAVNIIEEDILKVNLDAITPQPYRIVGNLPYNISTPILFLLEANRHAFTSAVVMLQKEVVERIIAKEGEANRGRLSIGMQRWFEVERLMTVPAGAFTPPPKVESAVIKLIPRNDPLGGVCNESLLQNIVARSFQQRRKMLRKSLQGIISDKVFETASIDPTRRPETLSLVEFVALCRAESNS